MKFKLSKLLMTLVALFAMTAGAWAQEETLLTTILSTGDNASFISGSKTFDNIATVTFSGGVNNDNDDWGWWSNYERKLTVTAADGYTITRVKFYTKSGSAFDETSPFEAILIYDGGVDSNLAKVNGTSIGGDGVTKIEVYGFAPTVAVTGVTLSPTSATLTAGGAALELPPTVAPEGATDKTVKWSVEQTGDFVALYTDEACTQAVGTDAIAAAKVYVKPLAAGQATVTVTTNDGAKTATCTVTVAEPTYNVTFKAGTEDVGNWTATPSSAKKGETVTVKYTGTKKVKSVKAVSTGEQAPSNFTANDDGTVWTLSSMPEYDVELEVEYFDLTAPDGNRERHLRRLDDTPRYGWLKHRRYAVLQGD